MGVEIERKFLLADTSWRNQVQRSERLIQGYLASDKLRSIRVRVQGDQALLNIKYSEDGIQRLEYEYPVPLDDAREILDKVAQRPVIDKIRHYIQRDGHLWEIDEFFGENAGLIVAEIELATVDEVFVRPPWLGAEVSQDQRYYNSNLARHPYTRW